MPHIPWLRSIFRRLPGEIVKKYIALFVERDGLGIRLGDVAALLWDSFSGDQIADRLAYR